MASVLDCLHYGKQNAVTREYLRTKTGLDDRAIRHEIRRLRVSEKLPIFNMQDGSGYFIATPDDWHEMLAACRMQDSRAREEVELKNIFHELTNKVMHPEGVQLNL